MSVLEQIAKLAPNDKSYFEKRLQEYRKSFRSDLAEKFTFDDMVRDELGIDLDRTPFRHWLYFVKRNYKEEPEVTPEVWDEWQAAKGSYKPDSRCVDYYSIPADPTDVARRRAEAERADAARKEREAKVAERQAAEARRLAALVAKLQVHEFEEIELEPVDYRSLHELKKHPDKAKRDIAGRWQERFEALSYNSQCAWQSFFGPVTVSTMPSPSSADDDDGNDDNDVGGDNAEPQIAHLMPLPVNGRDIDPGFADAIEVVLRDPEFEDFRRFSTGARRLLDLIGNPIDDVIVPPADPFRPQPAGDVDAIATAAKDVPRADIVPGFITRGLTIPHGDTKHCKSLLTQKAAIVVADDTGAKFEGIEVEHGTVIYVTLDLNATKEDIAPGIIEIRRRLGLKPSGRLHVTDAPLVLNEPASVEYFLELNKARLPCKMIVVDSLFSATAGSLIVDTVVRDAMEGVRTLLRHCNAVVVPHHDNKGGDIFGSQFIKAQMNSKIGVVRNVKDGSLGNRVTVTTEFLKFGDANLSPFHKLRYTLDGPYLHADAPPDVPEGVKRADILAKLPTAPIAISAARKMIERLLTGKTPKTREGQWARLRAHWQDCGVVAVDEKTGTISRRA
jgi:AAA domain